MLGGGGGGEKGKEIAWSVTGPLFFYLKLCFLKPPPEKTTSVFVFWQGFQSFVSLNKRLKTGQFKGPCRPSGRVWNSRIL